MTEYRFAGGRIISETGIKKKYSKTYMYNKDSFLIQYEAVYADGKQYLIYDRDARNRLIRYVDSFSYAGINEHIKEEQRIKYNENTTVVSFYKHPDKKTARSGNGLTLFKKITFTNGLPTEKDFNTYLERFHYKTDTAGNWIVMQVENFWMEDTGGYTKPKNEFTYRELEYSPKETTDQQPYRSLEADLLKQNTLVKYSNFLQGAF